MYVVPYHLNSTTAATAGCGGGFKTSKERPPKLPVQPLLSFRHPPPPANVAGTYQTVW